MIIENITVSCVLCFFSMSTSHVK